MDTIKKNWTNYITVYDMLSLFWATLYTGDSLNKESEHIAPRNAWQHQFNLNNFVCRLSWSISSNFGEKLLFRPRCAWQPDNAKKVTKDPYFSISRSFKVIDVGTPGKLLGSACYDTQQVCVYLQPFSC